MFMKTWCELKEKDIFYKICYHKRKKFLEILRCKVLSVKNLTEKYIKITYDDGTHPHGGYYERFKSWDSTMQYKGCTGISTMFLTEFNEDIVTKFENSFK